MEVQGVVVCASVCKNRQAINSKCAVTNAPQEVLCLQSLRDHHSGVCQCLWTAVWGEPCHSPCCCDTSPFKKTTSMNTHGTTWHRWAVPAVDRDWSVLSKLLLGFMDLADKIDESLARFGDALLWPIGELELPYCPWLAILQTQRQTHNEDWEKRSRNEERV